jgi:putative FmdB family regulatory protein
MPTYEYLCGNCSHAFEKFQSITAAPVRKCPECGKMKVRRLIGCGAGIIFKGSGFYETDYRSEGYKKAAKSEKEKAAPAKSEDKSKIAKKPDSPKTSSGNKKPSHSDKS